MNNMSKSSESFEERFSQGAHSHDLWKYDFTVGFNFHQCLSYRQILGRKLASLPTSNIYKMSLALPFEVLQDQQRISLIIKKRGEKKAITELAVISAEKFHQRKYPDTTKKFIFHIFAYFSNSQDSILISRVSMLLLVYLISNWNRERADVRSLLLITVDQQWPGFRNGEIHGVAFRCFRNAPRSIARAIGGTKFADMAQLTFASMEISRAKSYIAWTL